MIEMVLHGTFSVVNLPLIGDVTLPDCTRLSNLLHISFTDMTGHGWLVSLYVEIVSALENKMSWLVAQSFESEHLKAYLS